MTSTPPPNPGNIVYPLKPDVPGPEATVEEVIAFVVHLFAHLSHITPRKTAAYLGYETIEDLRRLQFHPTVLFWYLATTRTCGTRSPTTALTILSDKTDLAYFGEDLDELVSKFPIQNVTGSRDIRMVDNDNRDKGTRSGSNLQTTRTHLSYRHISETTYSYFGGL